MVIIENKGEGFVLKIDNIYESKQYDHIEKQKHGYVGITRHSDGGNSYEVYDIEGRKILGFIEKNDFLMENYNISLKNEKVIAVHYQKEPAMFNAKIYNEDTIFYYTYKGREINSVLDKIEYPQSYPKYSIVKMNEETNEITFSDGKVEKVFNIDSFSVVSTKECEQELSM